MLSRRIKSEKGSVEGIASILIIPFFIMVIFSLMNMGVYFQNKTSIQDFTRSAARAYAVDPENTIVITAIEQNLRNSNINQSSTNWTLSCGVQVGEDRGVPILVRNNAVIGDIVGCSISNYSFKSVYADPLGFSAFTSSPSTIYSLAISEVNEN